MKKRKPLEIDMIAGSQLMDTQGEMLSVEGADISYLQQGLGFLNDNHGKGFFNNIGRVTYAKKIFKAEDCEDERQEKYWEEVRAPYIYVRGILYDTDDHPNAKAAAAILRNIHKSNIPLKIKASVEGGVVSRGIADPSLLARTKIKGVALTFVPANNATLVEPLNLEKSLNTWETDLQLIKSVQHLAETNVPSFRHIVRDASASKILENIEKIQELRSQLGLTSIDLEIDKAGLIKSAIEEKVINNINKISQIISELNKGQKGNWEHEGYKLSHVMEAPNKRIPERSSFKVQAHDAKGNLAGEYHFSHNPHISEHLSPDDSVTQPEHRRKGLATAAYKYAENLSGKKIKNEDGYQSADAKALWNSKAFAKAEDEEFEKAFDQGWDAELEKGWKSKLIGAAAIGAGSMLAQPAKAEMVEQHLGDKIINARANQLGVKSLDGMHIKHFKDDVNGNNRIEFHSSDNVNQGINKPIFSFKMNSKGEALGPGTWSNVVTPEQKKALTPHFGDFIDVSSHVIKYPNFKTTLEKNIKNKAAALVGSAAMLAGIGAGIKSATDKEEYTKAAVHEHLKDMGVEFDKDNKPLPKKGQDLRALQIEAGYKATNGYPRLNKALTAGYGGAGTPTSMTGGSVMQSEALDDGRGFKYITCDDCGHEQIHHKYQVKCRNDKCRKIFSLEKISKFFI